MSSINYNYFFQVELLHKYFKDGTCNDFTFIASAKTRAALAGSRIILKQYGNKLYAGIQVDDSDKPFILPSSDFQLTFFLQLNAPLFFNYTNLPAGYPSGKLYYFTNRNNNVSKSKNFISQFNTYDSTITYGPGDIATDGSGTVFQCISTCKNVSPSISSANWMVIDSYQYVSEADALQWIPSVSTYTFNTAQASADVNVWAFDIATDDFSNNIISETTLFFQSSKSFKLDLSKLSPGKYKLRINDVTQWIYINDELSANPVFAVIEIFNDSSVTADYKLLKGTVLQSPLYSINFLNRATIWKYILKNSSKGIITVSPPGSPPDYNFPGDASSIIVSQSPIPLSEKPLNVSLELSTADPVATINSIACASPQRLTNYISGANSYACSEIFLNY